jgi:hypothetical protein
MIETGMYATILRPFLVVVALAAGLRVLVALGSGVVDAESSAHALLAFFGIPGLLILLAYSLTHSPRLRRVAGALAIGAIALSVASGAVALITVMLARARGVPVEAALLDVTGLRHAGAIALAAAGLCWGLLCAANILAPPEAIGAERR